MTDTAKQTPPAGDAASARRPRKRQIAMVILLVAVVLAAAFGVPYYIHALSYESTDDAFIEGHIVPISPRVAGHVIEVLVNDNQEVARDTVLVRLDPASFETRVKQAAGALAAAEASVVRTQAEVKVSQAEVVRADSTLARTRKMLASNAASDQDLDNAVAGAAAAHAKHDADQQKILEAQAAVQQAGAVLKQAQLELSYTEIKAPEAGRVTRKSVEAGAYVQVGQALLAIVPREVWVVANFKETQLTYMRPGQDVEVKVDAYPHSKFAAKVESIQAGTGSRFSLLPPENASGNYVKVVQRVPVKIVFTDAPQDVLLAPGMSVMPDVKVK